jgi:hypothetical protein
MEKSTAAAICHLHRRLWQGGVLEYQGATMGMGMLVASRMNKANQTNKNKQTNKQNQK